MAYSPTPDDRNSIVITKRFTYRGDTREFSNRYHFEGDVPADHAAWQTLADNIVDAEKTCYEDTVTIVEAVGNDASTSSLTNLHGDAVFTKVYAVDGTADYGSGAIPAPGDCAALIRYATTARSSKNHPVYLFNYYHGVNIPSTGGDALVSGQHADFNAYAAAWVTGFNDGTGARERCGPHGAVAISGGVKDMVTHRDLPR